MDECYAYEHFYGKSKAEAMDLLEESDMYYIEDFSYMPLEPFNYYFPVLLNYVLTEPRDEKSDAASMLLGLVRIETEFRTGKVDKHWDQINIALNEIALHQDDFGANEEIYGSFPRQVKLIRTLRLSQ